MHGQVNNPASPLESSVLHGVVAKLNDLSPLTALAVDAFIDEKYP